MRWWLMLLKGRSVKSQGEGELKVKDKVKGKVQASQRQRTRRVKGQGQGQGQGQVKGQGQRQRTKANDKGKGQRQRTSQRRGVGHNKTSVHRLGALHRSLSPKPNCNNPTLLHLFPSPQQPCDLSHDLGQKMPRKQPKPDKEESPDMPNELPLKNTSMKWTPTTSPW